MLLVVVSSPFDVRRCQLNRRSFNAASNTCAYTLLKERGGMLPRSSSNEVSVIRSQKHIECVLIQSVLKAVSLVIGSLKMDVDIRSEQGQNICTHSQPQMLIYVEHCLMKSTQKYTLVQFTKLFVLVAAGSLSFQLCSSSSVVTTACVTFTP